MNTCTTNNHQCCSVFLSYLHILHSAVFFRPAVNVYKKICPLCHCCLDVMHTGHVMRKGNRTWVRHMIYKTGKGGSLCSVIWPQPFSLPYLRTMSTAAFQTLCASENVESCRSPDCLSSTNSLALLHVWVLPPHHTGVVAALHLDTSTNSKCLKCDRFLWDSEKSEVTANQTLFTLTSLKNDT